MPCCACMLCCATGICNCTDACYPATIVVPPKWNVGRVSGLNRTCIFNIAATILSYMLRFASQTSIPTKFSHARHLFIPSVQVYRLWFQLLDKGEAAAFVRCLACCYRWLAYLSSNAAEPFVHHSRVAFCHNGFIAQGRIKSHYGAEQPCHLMSLPSCFPADKDGRIPGPDAVPFFKRSGLPQSDLKAVSATPLGSTQPFMRGTWHVLHALAVSQVVFYDPWVQSLCGNHTAVCIQTLVPSAFGNHEGNGLIDVRRGPCAACITGVCLI